MATTPLRMRCGARRMCNEAAQLVDRVLPNVPIRQWVLSLPWELRGVAASRKGLLGALDRIFAQEIARVTRRLAGRIKGAESGSIGCPQFRGSEQDSVPGSSLVLLTANLGAATEMV